MKKNAIKMIGLLLCAIFCSCEFFEEYTGGNIGNDPNQIIEISFIDEFVIADGTLFENTLIGGLSGIDYENGKWYLISDDPTAPIRFYTANIEFNESGFRDVSINGVTELKDKTGYSFSEGSVDPEAIRVAANGTIVWTSEGNINNGIDPFIRFSDQAGNFLSEALIAPKYKFNTNENVGPVHNGTFEGLCKAYGSNGYWVNMELPLKQDGVEPTIEDTESPIRISYLSQNGTFGKEFVYELDPVVRKASETAFTINGVVEILEYSTDQFLFLERSFSTGFTDGGNNVKIYKVDASNATNVRNMDSLEGETYIKATKELLFDFESIRGELTEGIVDNIEGITLGPVLENGNRSLVLVADNNFSAFGPQLNQFILLELIN